MAGNHPLLLIATELAVDYEIYLAGGGAVNTEDQCERDLAGWLAPRHCPPRWRDASAAQVAREIGAERVNRELDWKTRRRQAVIACAAWRASFDRVKNAAPLIDAIEEAKDIRR